MMENLLKRAFSCKYMVKPEHILGSLPLTRDGYTATLKIAWPSIVEAILVSLVAAVDTMMVGNLGPDAIKGNEVNDGLILLFDLAYKQEILPPQDFWSMGKIHIYVTKDKGEEPIDFTKFKEYAYQFNYEVIVNRNNNTFD